MKKTGMIKRLTAVILALILTLSLMPLSASAAAAFDLTLNYDISFGFVRESRNRTLIEYGQNTLLYIFPNTGCVFDSITVTNDKTGEEIETKYEGTSQFSYSDVALKYTFTMPYSSVTVDVDFSVDNEAGYYTVDFNYVGDGTAYLKRNGLGEYTHTFVAHADDRLLLKEPVPGEGYAFKDNCCYSSEGYGNVNIFENETFYMPARDITVNIVFEKLYDINVYAVGGSALVKSFYTILSKGFANAPVITSATEDEPIVITPEADENHNGDYLLKVFSESGELIERYSRDINFKMPAESVNVYITFYKDNYDVSCSAENGTLSYSTLYGTGVGQTVTLNAQPDEGFGLWELYYTYTPEAGSDEVRVDVDVNGDLSFRMPSADVQVRAVFSKLLTVEWLDGDGGLLDIKKYVSGMEEPVTDKIPVKEATWECSYEFAGWSAPAYYTGGLTVYRPIFDKVYAVLVGGGKAEPDQAKAGTLITLTPDEPYEGMYFTGWRVAEGELEFDGNTFIMPARHVSLWADYALKKTPDVNMEFSAESGYAGKPFGITGSVSENDEILDVGGEMTITFSSGAPEADGAESYTVPVENGLFSLDVPALTAGNNYVWAEYSGDGEYGTAMVMDRINIYAISAAWLTGVYDEPTVKSDYTVGDELDTENLFLNIYWMDGTRECIPVTADMVSGFDSSAQARLTLTVACPYPCEDELTYDVTVKAPQVSGILGDANGDGEVDAVDATIIQRCATNMAVPYPQETLMNGDIDGDGELTVVDATFIQRFCVNIKTPYPIGEAQ